MTMTTNTTTSRGLARTLLLGLACCTVAACSSSDPATSGGGGASSGGAPANTAGAVGVAGAPSAGAPSAGAPSAGAASAGAPSSGAPNTGGSGGNSVTAGSGGSGATGGGTAAGGSGVCAGVFCDGFEAGLTLGTAWVQDKAVAANTIEVVTGMAHTGNNSVHMKFTTASGATFIHEAVGFPAPMNSLWGRVWLYVMTGTNAGHTVYIEASDGVAGTLTNHGVRPLNTQNSVMSINIDPNASNGEDSKATTMAIPRGKWTCFEWQIAATAGRGSVTLYMDSTQIATIPSTVIPPLAFMRVGYEHYNPDAAAGDLWIDDYALGTARIPCN
jgi:hypothetical protein